MTDITPLAGSATLQNPSKDLFTIPPKDLGVFSSRTVGISTFNSGITPVYFQIGLQEDYVDLGKSYFEYEIGLKKAAGGNLVANQDLYLENNFSHTIWKQIDVGFNGTLLSQRTDTYHIRAYLEALLNHNRQDGGEILTPEG